MLNTTPSLKGRVEGSVIEQGRQSIMVRKASSQETTMNEATCL